MKKLTMVFFACLITAGAFSQERQVSHYMYDHTSFNAGSVGGSDMISTHAIIRQQWPGIEGAPTNFILNLSAPFRLGTTHHGVGLSIWQDNLGFNSDIDLKLSYAYQFQVGNGRLGIGVSGNFINREVDGTKWIPPDSDVPSDGVLPTGNPNEFAIDLGAGLFYTTEELYVGLSSTRILESEFNYENAGSTTASEKLPRQYYLTAGYSLQMANPLLELLPSIFVATDTKVTKIDVNATIMYNKKFWGGVSYRVGSAVVGMVGLSILNGVKVGYAYDFDTSKLSNVSKGSHEIMVGYDFRIGVDRIPQKYKSIRYL